MALLLVLLAAPPASADAPDDRARRALDVFLSGWIERHPEQASRLGDHSRDGVLPLLSSAARARDATWYRAQRDSLASLQLEALTASRAIDVRLALDRAAYEAALTEDRLPERDPGYVLERLRVALSVPIRGFHASPCSRAAALRSRLRAVPELLRDARIAAAAPDRVATEHALVRVETLLELCRVDLPRALTGCREARVQADLAQADSLATQALTEFAAHLRETRLARATTDSVHGRDALALRLGGIAGDPVALDTLLARARAEWARRNEAIETARGASDEAPARIGLDSAAVLSALMRNGLVAAGEYSADLEERLELRDRPAPRGEEPFVSLGPWDPRGARARVDLGWQPGMHPGAGVLADDPLFSRTAIELVLAREGVPGRAAFAAAEARGASRVRQALGHEAIRDGWARYAESVWLRALADTARDVATLRIERLERERLARAIAELMLRVESASVEDAARWLERGAALSPAAAGRAALEAAAAPRWAASTLAFWRIRDLRVAAEGANLGRFDAAGFHRALMREGAVPTAWIATPVRLAAAQARGRRR